MTLKATGIYWASFWLHKQSWLKTSSVFHLDCLDQMF